MVIKIDSWLNILSELFLRICCCVLSISMTLYVLLDDVYTLMNIVMSYVHFHGIVVVVEGSDLYSDLLYIAIYFTIVLQIPYIILHVLLFIIPIIYYRECYIFILRLLYLLFIILFVIVILYFYVVPIIFDDMFDNIFVDDINITVYVYAIWLIYIIIVGIMYVCFNIFIIYILYDTHWVARRFCMFVSLLVVLLSNITDIYNIRYIYILMFVYNEVSIFCILLIRQLFMRWNLL